MKISVLNDIILFVFLILLQVLFLNQINIFGVATPLLYIYFLIKLPMGCNRFYVIISAFLMGFIIDIFLNTPGMNAAATTIVATFRRPFMNLIYSKEEYEDFVPSIYHSSKDFIWFAGIIVIIHQILLFFIESFTFFNLTNTLIRIAASSAITLVLIFAMDGLMYRKVESE